MSLRHYYETQLWHTDEPLLPSQRPTPVTNFIKALLNGACVDHIMKTSPLWDRLHNAWVNFSHITEDMPDKYASNSLSQKGLFAAYLRGRAIQCKRGQVGLDIVIPMAVLSNSKGLTSRVDPSHMSAIIIQVKNRERDGYNFTSSFIAESQFDMRHFSGLKKPTSCHPYVGIWMSFRSQTVDFTVAGRDPKVFKPNSPNSFMSQSDNSLQDQNDNGKRVYKNSHFPNASRKRPNILRSTPKCGYSGLDAQFAGGGYTNKLVVRARGFEELYNRSLPLSILRPIVHRHLFSSSIAGVKFPTEFIRDQSLRPIWNTSSMEMG